MYFIGGEGRLPGGEFGAGRMWSPSIGDGFSLPLNCTLEAVAFVISIPVLFSSCSIFLTLRLPFAAIFRGDTEGFTTAFDAISNRGEN